MAQLDLVRQKTGVNTGIHTRMNTRIHADSVKG